MEVLVDALALLVISKTVNGFKMKSPFTPLIAALVYAVLYAVLFRIAFPMITVAAGLSAILVGPLAIVVGAALFFAFNVAMLVITDKLLEDFEMDGISTAMIASVLLSVIHHVTLALLGTVTRGA